MTYTLTFQYKHNKTDKELEFRKLRLISNNKFRNIYTARYGFLNNAVYGDWNKPLYTP